MEIENKQQLHYLRKIKPRLREVENLSTHAIAQLIDEVRLEHMAFADNNNLQHSWSTLLDNDMDKTTIQSI